MITPSVLTPQHSEKGIHQNGECEQSEHGGACL